MRTGQGLIENRAGEVHATQPGSVEIYIIVNQKLLGRHVTDRTKEKNMNRKERKRRGRDWAKLKPGGRTGAFGSW